MDDRINLALADQEDTTPVPVELPQEDRAAPISPEVAERRAFKVKYGLDAILKKSQEEIFNNLVSGEEGSLRVQAAGEIDKRKQEQTQSVIRQVIGQKGGPLSPAEAMGITQMVSNLNEKTDPASVFEESYAKQFMFTIDEIANRDPSSAVAKLRAAFPEYVAAKQEQASGLLAQRTFLETILEDTEADLKNQGWIPYSVDFMKGLFPGYTDAKLRGHADTSIFAGLTLGGNLEETRKNYLRLPFKEFMTKFTADVNKMKADNPQLAVEFIRSMIGMTSDEATMKSLTLPVDFIGLGIGKATVKGGKALLKDAGLIATKKEADKAIEDITKAGLDPNVSKSTIEAASGDLQQSAITRTVTNRVAELSGQPRATEQAIESLSSVFRADEALVAANPGKYGQDIVNRIVESSQKITDKLFNAAKNVSKVERLPEIMSNEVAVRAILEDMKGTYRGINNSVIDMSKPYKEPVGNTWLSDMLIGNNDGTYFKTKTQAENFAEFHGLKDARIGEGKDVKFTKRFVEEAKYTKNISDAQNIISKNQAKVDDPKVDNQARSKALEQIQLAEEYIVDQATARKALGQTVTVEQQGFGYYIKITKPIDETRPIIRQFIAETENTKIPDSALRRFLNSSPVGKYRTPEETLSLKERQNRLVATYTPSVYFDIMRQNAPVLNDILGARFGKGRQRRKEFERILKAGQEMKDPDSIDDVGGYFFKSPADLEEHYLRINGRLPDKDEIQAYFEFKRGMEIDRVFRNIAEHRNQQRVGAETVSITTVDDTGKAIASPEFSAVSRGKLVRADDNILIMGDRIGEERIRSLQGMSAKELKDFQKEMDGNGYRLFELYGPENKPLAGFGSLTDEHRVRYVLARTADTRELDWQQIPRRGGGHMEMDYDNYIKQAKVTWDEAGKRWWYEGDTTLMPIQVRAMGVKVAGHLNKVRELLKAKDEAAAKAYSDKNLHIDWDTVNGWFKSDHDANGKYRAARLSLNEPIQVVTKNDSIIGMDKELERRYAGDKAGTVLSNFKNGMKEGSLARQNQVEYSAKRDAYDMFTFKETGTKQNPLYEISPVDMIDPVTTLNRGLARIAKSNFLDDYKTMSVEHWLKQASKYMEPTDHEIWHSPFYHFHNPKWKTDAPPEARRALETAWLHTQQLTGVPGTTDAWLHSQAQKAYDTLYNVFGTKGLVIDPGWLLPKLKDPFAFARSVAFHTKLGLWNVPQFIVQAGNYGNILGIAGAKYATPGTLGAQLHFWSKVNSREEIINHLDGLASKMNVPGAAKWRPGEFKEAWTELNKTGFGNVGSEYAILDNPMSDKIIQDGVSTFLDWGTYFFRQGERNAKYGAWYTAFKEFRDKNPLGRITEADRAEILQRADLLNLNMSRASSSQLHSGIFSIPTQFYTYQIRLMELMFGSRLGSGKEGIKNRAYLFATNAALYGIPMAGGLTGLPIADYMRKYALENDYIVGDNFWSSLLMEGVPSMLGAVITGRGDYQKGTFADVGSRFGTKGLEFIGGLNRTDKTPLDILGGPIYGIVKNFVQQTDGFRAAMLGLIKGDYETFPIVVEDVVDCFKEITSINTAWRTYAAIDGGRWLSKKDAVLAENISPAGAMFSAISGLKDQRITDINTMANSMKDKQEYDAAVEKQFLQEFQRAVISDDDQMRHKFLTRAMAWLEFAGYDEDRRADLVNKASRNAGDSMLDKMNMDFYLRRAPDSRRERGLTNMERLEQLKEKRGEQ